MNQNHNAYRRTTREIRWMTYAVPLLSVMSVLLCLIPEITSVPAWAIFLVNIPLTIRIVGMNHELFHEPPSKLGGNLLLRLNLHVYTPLTIGFDEYRELHLRHHAYDNSDRDPDFRMIRDGKHNALWRLALAPEYWFLYCMKHGILSRDFWLLHTGRMLVLAGYVALVGVENYLLLFLLPTKLAFALSFLVFSYESHTDATGKPRSIWNLKPRLTLLNRAIYWSIGPYAYNIAYHHATHHAYPWVSGVKLSDVRGPDFPLAHGFPERSVLF